MDRNIVLHSPQRFRGGQEEITWAMCPLGSEQPEGSPKPFSGSGPLSLLGRVGWRGGRGPAPRGPVCPYLICPVGPSPEEEVSHWAGAEEGPTVLVKVREARTTTGTRSSAGASGFRRHCQRTRGAAEEARAGWGAEAAGPARRKAAGRTARGACCSEGEAAAQAPGGWPACCPPGEAAEGACHPRPCSE